MNERRALGSHARTAGHWADLRPPGVISGTQGVSRWLALWCTLWALLLVSAGGPSAQAAGATPLATVERDGVRLRVWLQPGAGQAQLQSQKAATLRVAVSSTLDDAPLPGLQPGAWVDRLDGAAPDGAACARRVGGYLSRGLTERPWRDLTGYHVLLLNGDASISVLDPRTNFAGKSSLRTVVPLPGNGFDWDLSPAHDRLFVSVPATQQVVVVDMATLDQPLLLKAPGSPGRVRLHPAGGQVWVGVPQPAPRRSNTGVQPGEGGVWLLDANDPTRHAWVATGNGHHEFAFDPDGLTLVTNRDAGTVSFVDGTLALERRRANTGGVPIAAAFDTRARQFIVAEAREGALLRFDHTGRAIDRLSLSPGLGPMAVSPDGRWLLVLNPAGHRVHVVDLLAWRQAHDIAVGGRPFQLEFSSAFAYVRALDREDVTMVQLASLAGTPLVQRFTAGEKRPADAPELPLASQMSVLPDDTGVFVLSPQDGTLYTYMQGMNAPMGGISPRGHPLRAVRVARQGLLPVGRGIYEARVTMPHAPAVMLALATDRPSTRHCLRVALAPNDAEHVARPTTRIEWQVSGDAQSGRSVGLTLDGDAALAWPPSLKVWVFQPGGARVALLAERTGLQALDAATGRAVYAARVADLPPGAYYAHVSPTSDGVVTPALARQFASFEIAEGDRR